MPTCFRQRNNGTIVEDPVTCDYVLLTQTEVDDLVGTDAHLTALTDLTDTLNLIFATPTTAELTQGFMAGFSLPLFFYLVAWAYGVVVNQFKDQDHGPDYLD